MRPIFKTIAITLALGTTIIATGCEEPSSTGSDALNAIEQPGVTVTDEEIREAAGTAAAGLEYMSEANYPFHWVHAELDGETSVTEELVRETMVSYVDDDPDADKPLAELFADVGDWSVWRTVAEDCDPDDDPYYLEMCTKQADLDQVLEENLRDIQVYYFGADGEPGYVNGIGVSIFIVGITPAGNLAGMRTLAIWT